LNGKNREKFVMIAGGAVLLIVLYLFVLVLPTMDSIQRKKKQLEANQKNIVKLKSLLEEHRKSAQSGIPRFRGSLSAFVENKAREGDIAIAYVRPYGEKGQGVEVKVEGIDGKKLVWLLYQIDSQGITLSRLNMRDYKGTGEWAVKLNLEV
jgi:type II secretory pathway component PulM